MSNRHYPESMRARVRAWAHAQLDLPPTATAAQAHSRMLALLEDEQFAPPEPWIDAYRVVAGSPGEEKSPAVPAAFLIENERQLLQEIDEFRSCMLQRPPAERVRQWKQLAERSRSVPRAAARTELLEPALHADLGKVSEENSYVRRLAEYAVELFGLPPQAQGIRRRRLLQEMCWEVENWESAVRRMRTGYPELAAVDPLLLDRIEGLTEDRKWTADRAAKLQRGPALRSSATPSFSGSLVMLRLVVVAVVVATGTIRLATSSVSRRDPPVPWTPIEPLRTEGYPWDTETRPKILFSPEDRESLLNMSEEELREQGGRDVIVILGLEEEWKRRQAERKWLGQTGPVDVVPPGPQLPGGATNFSDQPQAEGSPREPATPPALP